LDNIGIHPETNWYIHARLGIFLERVLCYVDFTGSVLSNAVGGFYHNFFLIDF